MKANSFEFRFHVPILVFIYLLGFYAPWERYTGNGQVKSAWLAAPSLFTHLGISLGDAVQVITIICLLCAAIGTGLRLWGSAATISASQNNGFQVGTVATHRYPLYLGSWLFHFSLIILMPPTGALFVLLAQGLLTWRLLQGKQGSNQLSAAEHPGGRAWGRAVLAESYFVSYFFCFAILAWRYDAFLLVRCAILCFGSWLVLKAVSSPDKRYQPKQ
jgi:hypothetical protein